MEEVEVPAIIAANPPTPPCATLLLPLPISLSFPSPCFLILTLAQSCQLLHTLHTFPCSSSMSPGGRFGWVSFVVRRG